MPATHPRRTRPVGVACYLAVAAVAAIAISACGEPRDDRIPGPDLLAEVETEVVATVDIDDDGFAVGQLEVEPGQAIELVNTTGESVRVRGSTGGDLAYDTGGLLPDESTLIVLEDPGRYTFQIDDGEIDEHEAPTLEVGVDVTPRPAPEAPVTEPG